MNDSESPDLVQAIKEGVGPLLVHVRDEEQSILSLPLYLHSAVSEFELLSLVLGPFVGSIEVPRGAMVQSVPDHTCAHWMWPDGSSLLLLQWGLSNLPHLEAITRWPVGTRHLIVNNRPMALRVETAEATSIAQIDGYIDDSANLGVNIHARNLTQFDALIAAVTTLRLIRHDSNAGA